MPLDSGAGRASLGDVQRAWLPLVEQSDRIADSITLALLERDAEIYDQVGPDLRGDVRESTRVHIRRGLEVLTGKRPAGSSAAAEVWRETGRRRARQGVPLELVLNAYTVGARMLWEALVGHSRRGTEDRVAESVLLLAAQIVWSNLDVQNAVLIGSYRRESLRLTRADLQRQQSVLDGLIEGRGADPEHAAEVREVLGIDPDAAVACLVALPEDGVDGGLSQCEDRLERVGWTVRWHVRGGTYFGLVAVGAVTGKVGSVTPELDEEQLVQVVGTQVQARVGVCVAQEGVSGFAAAYQLATRAAETMPRGRRGAVAVSQRLPEVLLAGSPQVVPLLLRETLGRLLTQPEPQARTLLDTLAALLRHDGSPTHAAEELYCHRNTVIYRLKQIEELTGRSLADPRDKLLLELAVLAHGR
ncbi:Purine catabolism regulatory protein [Nocardioides dokdonensis FR1436]|uniref:Purine catabolism regulatory protein n=1 Tax=Nocardioides dokdonensis FR1436 TaxID=1300347 RepID=A0A1A9GF55_9ACTN|nr:helix-turn-helix domain-containing protein [Nocardioides dokdonensis]ANH36884.1 Purine catabolism regulatory protein [Nocardioides dokdonensis FR1436]